MLIVSGSRQKQACVGKIARPHCHERLQREINSGNASDGTATRSIKKIDNIDLGHRVAEYNPITYSAAIGEESAVGVVEVLDNIRSEMIETGCPSGR